MCDVPVEHADGEIARRNQREERSQRPGTANRRRCAVHRRKSRTAHQQHSEERERAEIGAGRVSQQKTTQSFDGSRLVSETCFELGQAVVDQVVADVCFAVRSASCRFRVGQA